MTVETTAPPVTTVVTTTTVPVTQTTPAPIPSGVNPLTGESGYREEAIGKRPVAVMVNNIRDALPQYGIAQADIIYEMLVEGGITRLMAVYADYGSMPNICSVRSCRYYYPIVALGMDAIYCHWGMDQTIAKDTLNRLRIDHLDGGGNGWQLCFFRDTERMMHYASEHTGFLKGSKIPDAIEQYGFRTETDHGNAFCFRDPKELVSCKAEAGIMYQRAAIRRSDGRKQRNLNRFVSMRKMAMNCRSMQAKAISVLSTMITDWN